MSHADDELDLIEPSTLAPYYGDKGGGPYVHLTDRCPSVKRAINRGDELLRSRGKLSDLDSTITLCGWCRRWRGNHA